MHCKSTTTYVIFCQFGVQHNIDPYCSLCYICITCVSVGSISIACVHDARSLGNGVLYYWCFIRHLVYSSCTGVICAVCVETVFLPTVGVVGVTILGPSSPTKVLCAVTCGLVSSVAYPSKSFVLQFVVPCIKRLLLSYYCLCCFIIYSISIASSCCSLGARNFSLDMFPRWR